MAHQNPKTPAPLFRSRAVADLIPSSSPAFGTPVHPIRKPDVAQNRPTILPILLPPPILRPLAFRTFTKKHNLTLTSAALQNLASFIGNNCGAGWKEEGLAERVLEEVAKGWKRCGGGVIVEGDSPVLKGILKTIEAGMSGGRINTSGPNGGLTRENSLSFQFGAERDMDAERPGMVGREDSTTSLGLSSLGVQDEELEGADKDPRKWLKVVSAFEHPRLVYDAGRKHFEKSTKKPSAFPPPSHKTHLFRHRYNLILQRLLRNEAFQAPAFAASRQTSTTAYKITPISNLLGRTGSSHLLLGLLTISPTGTLAISDLTGSIALDLRHAKVIGGGDGVWLTPGMIVLIEGTYEEDYNATGAALGGGGGIGGTIGGKFLGFSVGGPPCEKREITLGTGSSGKDDGMAGGGFGWVDFIGVGSERALGSRMRKIESQVLDSMLDLGSQDHSQSGAGYGGRARMVIIGDVNLDSPRMLQALRKVLGHYATETPEETPLSVILIGNFVKYAVMAGGGSGGSIEYKEYFDVLASTLAEFPTLLQNATFVFVPGDNDPWASAFSAGGATTLPRKAVPDLFTSRVKRAFTNANAEVERGTNSGQGGEAVWTTNPARLSLFGPTHEMVIFRDDISDRLRRNAITLKSTKGQEEPTEEASRQADFVPPPPTAEDGMDLDKDIEEAESHAPANDAAVSYKGGVAHSTHAARKLVKTILDQGYLSPFPLDKRPIMWDYDQSLQLYPLPTTVSYPIVYNCYETNALHS
jgi:DNA polymerase epsilon subunit 2